MKKSKVTGPSTRRSCCHTHATTGAGSTTEAATCTASAKRPAPPKLAEHPDSVPQTGLGTLQPLSPEQSQTIKDMLTADTLADVEVAGKLTPGQAMLAFLRVNKTVAEIYMAAGANAAAEQFINRGLEIAHLFASATGIPLQFRQGVK